MQGISELKKKEGKIKIKVYSLGHTKVIHLPAKIYQLLGCPNEFVIDSVDTEKSKKLVLVAVYEEPSENRKEEQQS